MSKTKGRMILVKDISGDKYLGYTEEKEIEAGGILFLNQVRYMNELRQPALSLDENTRERKVVGFQTLMTLMPIDCFEGAVDNFGVIVASWYYPGDHGDRVMSKFKNLIKNAELNETATRADEAGIQLVNAAGLPKGA